MDKAARTAQKHIDEDNRRINIQERLRKKEFIARCNAVRMCHTCGEDWVDIAGPSNHHVIYSCQNRDCSEYNITKEHIYPKD